MEEEVVLLEEQLAAAHTDVERLQARLAEAEARPAALEVEAAELRRRLDAALTALAEREAAFAEQAAELERLRTALAEAQAQAVAAARRYREAALAREPDLPAELVVGETVDEVEASLARARQTVAQVRQHLEQQAQAIRIPAGAPARGGPDLSALTSTEKIRLGLRQAG